MVDHLVQSPVMHARPSLDDASENRVSVDNNDIANEESEKIKLRTKDEEIFEVEKHIAEMSTTLEYIIEDTDEGEEMIIPVPTITSNTLTTVIRYCKYHFDSEQKSLSAVETQTWDHNYMKMDDQHIFELILAANYLDIKSLLDLTCKTVANEIKGKTTEEIRVRFDITNDFTPEEEEEIRQENRWCEEH